MESRCTHDRDTVCRPCKPGYYNEAVNYEPCKPCTQCSQSEHHGCPAPTSRLDRGGGLPCPPEPHSQLKRSTGHLPFLGGQGHVALRGGGVRPRVKGCGGS